MLPHNFYIYIFFKKDVIQQTFLQLTFLEYVCFCSYEYDMFYIYILDKQLLVQLNMKWIINHFYMINFNIFFFNSKDLHGLHLCSTQSFISCSLKVSKKEYGSTFFNLLESLKTIIR